MSKLYEKSSKPFKAPTGQTIKQVLTCHKIRKETDLKAYIDSMAEGIKIIGAPIVIAGITYIITEKIQTLKFELHGEAARKLGKNV